MNNIKKYNNFISESIKDKMVGKSLEDVEKYIDKSFDYAYKHGYNEVDISSIDDFWFDLIDKYHLYNNYYLYKDKIFIIIDNIDYVEIEDIGKSKEEYKEELQNKVNTLQDVIKKLD